MINFIYNWVANARSASNPKQFETTFQKFVESLKRPAVRSEKDGPAIVLATFGDKRNQGGNRRHDGNVECLTGFALDLDKGSSEEEIRACLRGIKCVAHTTFSHSEQTPKWRVIIPFTSPVKPSRAKALFDDFNKRLKGNLDPACKNSSRIYYLPACPPEHLAAYRCFVIDGDPFDPDSALTGVTKPAKQEKFDLSSVLNGAQEGDRDDRLFRLACKLRAIGVPLDKAEEIMLVAASRCTPPFDPEEAKKKLASAWRYAKAGMLTDLANSQRLVHQNNGRIRYVHKFRKWIYWNGNRWQYDEDGHVSRLARQTVMSIYNEIIANPESAEELIKHAKQSQQAARLEAMERLARTEQGIPIAQSELDADPWLLGTPSGVIDLRTGNIRKPAPQDYITKSANFDLNPNAHCNTWLKFLLEIMDGKEHLVQFLQRAIGYTLTGLTQEQCLFFLYGGGANGKSTLLNVLRGIFGDYSIQTAADTLVARRDRGIPNDIARMRGARLIVTSELEEGTFLAEGLVKQLTGGDTIVARFLFAEYFEFTPAFKIWLAANYKPRIHGDDYAIWRRIRLIPFLVEIPPEQRDPALPEKLLKEAEGILAWTVQGCLDWQANGLMPPEEVSAATSAYRFEMDTFNHWLEERCIVDLESSETRTKSSVLYGDYCNWSKANGLRPVSTVRFASRLGNKGVHKSRNRDGVFYIGIRLIVDESLGM